eukprot:6959302-Pyramimonas_sp.AAC.1
MSAHVHTKLRARASRAYALARNSHQIRRETMGWVGEAPRITSNPALGAKSRGKRTHGQEIAGARTEEIGHMGRKQKRAGGSGPAGKLENQIGGGPWTDCGAGAKKDCHNAEPFLR